MDIITNFGINPILLIAQIVNFLILLYLLKRFAYKPIFTMLEGRKKTIEEGLKNAEEAKKAFDKAIEEEKKILRKAQDAAKQILSDAKNQADQIAKESEEKTKGVIEQMMIDTRKKMEQESKDMEKRLAVSTAALAVSIIKEAVSDIFNEKEQKEVIEKLTQKFTGK
jgi:F-type H+-transporting ATPase subunit b